MPDRTDRNPFPEKVMQFGTGILLRGLPDYFIDQANRKGIFCGSIVVIKSTPGSAKDFGMQNGRFTTCVRGIDQGKKIEEDLVNTAISRVMTVRDQWPEILAAAGNPDLQVVISNTTEVGIQFEPELIFQTPPNSFPAKLTGILFERFKKLGSESGELVVIPTELVPDNGKKLKDIVLQLTAHNKLGSEFIHWLSQKILFCSSLVDRIVTKPSEAVKQFLADYDSLTIQVEPYNLWAIEGGEKVKKILSFAEAGEGVIIADSIEYYRERKIRLLNGTHTISVCLGFLLGFDTVYECMQDREMSAFIEGVMMSEIKQTLSLGTKEENKQFASEVLDRFRNPYTAHRLLSITLQATAKMKMRNVATFLRYGEQFHRAPDLLAKGFAAYLLFMKAVKKEGGHYFGLRGGTDYPILDDQAGYFYETWKNVDPGDEASRKSFVRKICQNRDLWDHDLTQLPKFAEAVTAHFGRLIHTLKT